jgi:polyisoprenoid-binding protein YceI
MVRVSLVFVGILFLSLVAQAQRPINNEYSTMEIHGTSNVHDWTQVVETLNGSLVARVEDDKLKAIDQLEITIPVASIKSGKATMDRNTYNAMRAREFPEITFVLKSVSISGDKVLCTGELTIAGTTNTITMTCIYTLNTEKGWLMLNGSHHMKMTSYNIDPPVAMSGAMRTGDAITIKFSLVIDL